MTDYDDLLLTISGEPPTFASYVENFNAGEASVDGFELDVIGMLGEATTISFNYTYLDTELSDVIVPQDSFLLGGPPASTVDLRGVDISNSTYIPFAPESAYSIAFDHSWGLSGGASLDFHLNYSWRDEVFSTPARGLPVDALGLLGGRIALSGWQLGATQVKIAAWGKNLTDESEIVYDLSALGFQYNMPRMYGVSLTLEF
jgi:iron complex outermembrane receptor protein